MAEVPLLCEGIFHSPGEEELADEVNDVEKHSVTIFHKQDIYFMESCIKSKNVNCDMQMQVIKGPSGINKTVPIAFAPKCLKPNPPNTRKPFWSIATDPVRPKTK